MGTSISPPPRYVWEDFPLPKVAYVGFLQDKSRYSKINFIPWILEGADGHRANWTCDDWCRRLGRIRFAKGESQRSSAKSRWLVELRVLVGCEDLCNFSSLLLRENDPIPIWLISSFLIGLKPPTSKSLDFLVVFRIWNLGRWIMNLPADLCKSWISQVFHTMQAAHSKWNVKYSLCSGFYWSSIVYGGPLASELEAS